MIRGTTPILKINVKSNVNLADVVQMWATITNENYERTFDINAMEIDAEAKTIIILLSQEDTLAFPVGTASIQLRGLLSDETAFASKIKQITISKILKDGVIA